MVSTTYFNPRACVRHDISMLPVLAVALSFQSTCLREARRDPSSSPSKSGRFQSTCLREARQQVMFILLGRGKFQSTCLREARRPGIRGAALLHHFNPRACVRHDCPDRRRSRYSAFQSTCLREARQRLLLCIEDHESHFNPRACVRHDP